MKSAIKNKLDINISVDEECISWNDLKSKYEEGGYDGIILKGDVFAADKQSIKIGSLCNKIREIGGKAWAETNYKLEDIVHHEYGSGAWYIATCLDGILVQTKEGKEVWRKKVIGVGYYEWKCNEIIEE